MFFTPLDLKLVGAREISDYDKLWKRSSKSKFESYIETSANYTHKKKSFDLVKDILDILVQCNRSKPTPTCTSSLGFNCL